MKKRLIRIFALSLVLCMCLGSGVCASEIVENEYGEPNPTRWSYTSSAIEALTISSSGTANMSASVTGYSGTTTKIIIYFYLQKYNTDTGTWFNVKTYRDQSTNWFFDVYHTYSSLERGRYRLRCNYYVYGPDGYYYDNFMSYTNEKTY